MDRKIYLKKLYREIRRVDSAWEDCYNARDWETLNQLGKELNVLVDKVDADARTFKCYGINDFFQELESLRKPPSNYPYDNRITHCYLTCEDIKFEVRGWEFVDGVIYVSGVNWSHMAGTCTVTINSKNFRQFRITKD